MPSLFTNEHSRGPLYQYWKERGTEEKSMREQRVQEAQIRSKGFTPTDAAYGPSSKESYANREGRGPPGYVDEIPTTTTGEGSVNIGTAETGATGDDLPAYIDTTAMSPTQHAPGNETLLSATEEKAHLARLEEQHRQTRSDAAVARTLSTSNDGVHRDGAEGEGEEEGKGKEPERKKSTAGKVGRWLADAATGYTKKQERW